MKAKQCTDCNKVGPIWKNYGRDKCCRSCSAKREPKEQPKRSPVKKVSAKRAKELRVDKKLRDAFMEGKTCEFPGCTQPATDRHHMQGRENERLIDTTLWKALCREHHRLITDDSALGVRLGLSVSRHKRA